MKNLVQMVNESFDGHDTKSKVITKIKGYDDSSTRVHYSKQSMSNRAMEVLGSGNMILQYYHALQASMIVRVKTNKIMELVLFHVRKDDPAYDVVKKISKKEDEIILRCGFGKNHLGAKTNMTIIKYKPKSKAIYFLDSDYENHDTLHFENKQYPIYTLEFESAFFDALNKHLG